MEAAARVDRRRQVVLASLIAAVFVVTYVLVLALGSRLHPTLATVPSATLLAIALAAPLLAPAIVEYLLPRMTAIKITQFLEISLNEASTTRGPSLNALVDQLAIPLQTASANDYAVMMTSYSAVIVETVRNLGVDRTEVLPVDLRRNNAWIPPNLYLLALLVSRRTAVRHIVFVETGDVEEMFVCGCEPRELAGSLAVAYPILAAAAGQAEASKPGGDTEFARLYFQNLAAVYQQSVDAAATKEIWLSSSTLIPLLGPFANRAAVERQETLSADTCKAVLQSPSGFVAAVQAGQLMAVLHRERIALTVARGLLAEVT